MTRTFTQLSILLSDRKRLSILLLFCSAFAMQGFGQTTITWQKSIGTEYADNAVTIFPDQHGNLVCIGFEPHSDFTGNLRNYMLLTKIDPAGNVIWKTYHDVQFETFSLPVDYSIGKHFYTEEFGDTLLNLIISISNRTLQYKVRDQTGDYYFYEEIPGTTIDINLKNEKVYATVLCSAQQSCYGPDSMIVQSFDPTPDSTFNPIVWTYEVKQNFRTAPIQGHYDFNVQDIRFDTEGNAYLLVQIERWDFQFCTDCNDAFIDAWCEVFKFDPQGQLVNHVNIRTAKAAVSGMRFIALTENEIIIHINDINSAGTKVLSWVYRLNYDLSLVRKIEMDNSFAIIRTDEETNLYTIRNVFDANDPNVKGLSDILVSKYDKGGTLQWKQYFGGSSWEFPFGLSLGQDGGIYFLANSESTDFDVAENNGSQDMWLVKLTEGTTSTGPATGAGKFNFYPNPASDVLHIDNVEDIHRLEVFDLYGRLLKNIEVNQDHVNVDVSDVPSGSYIVRGRSGRVMKSGIFYKN